MSGEHDRLEFEFKWSPAPTHSPCIIVEINGGDNGWILRYVPGHPLPRFTIEAAALPPQYAARLHQPMVAALRRWLASQIEVEEYHA